MSAVLTAGLMSSLASADSAVSLVDTEGGVLTSQTLKFQAPGK